MPMQCGGHGGRVGGSSRSPHSAASPTPRSQASPYATIMQRKPGRAAHTFFAPHARLAQGCSGGRGVGSGPENYLPPPSPCLPPPCPHLPPHYTHLPPRYTHLSPPLPPHLPTRFTHLPLPYMHTTSLPPTYHLHYPTLYSYVPYTPTLLGVVLASISPPGTHKDIHKGIRRLREAS